MIEIEENIWELFLHQTGLYQFLSQIQIKNKLFIPKKEENQTKTCKPEVTKDSSFLS